MWDTSEYIAAAYVLGIPHPPGNPFFVLIATRLLDPADRRHVAAMRINILAALCSAASAGIWFLVTERVLVGWLPERWQQRVGGRRRGAARRNRVHGVEPVGREREGVHGVARVLRDRLVAHRARGATIPKGRTADRLLVLIAFLLGLGYANHLAGFLVGAGGGRGGARCAARRRFCAGGCCSRSRARSSLGLTPFRRRADSRRALPGDQRGRADGVHDEDRAVVHVQLDARASGFMDNINREQYGKPALERSAGAVHRAGRHVVAVLQVAVAARCVRHGADGLQGAARRRSSCCSGSPAATCTSSATDDRSGSSGRSCSR